MIYDNLIADGDSIGISIPLPNGDGSDLTGFGITYNMVTDSSTVGSYFYSGATAKMTSDHAWICNVRPMDATHTMSTCFHFQPKSSDEVGSNYRWSAGDPIYPQGWTNINGQLQLYDITNGSGATLLSA